MPLTAELALVVEAAIQQRDARREDAEIRFRCPAAGHDDQHPSARWNPEKAVWHCDACGEGGGVIDLAGRLGVGLPNRQNGRAPTDSWDIRDPDGQLIARHEKYITGAADKQFKWRRPGYTVPGLHGLRAADLPLYGAEQTADWPDGATVTLHEGEKAADAGRALGCRSLGTVTGANITPSDETLRPLTRFDVVLCRDNDAPGLSHMRGIAARLEALGVRPRWLDWGDVPAKYDAADFRAAGGTPEQFAAMIEAAASNAPAASTPGLPFVTAREIAASTSERPDFIVRPWAARGAIAECVGKLKASGKTTFLTWLSHSVVYGKPFLGEPVQRCPVVYCTEQSRATFREALRRAHLLDCEDLHVLCWPEVHGVEWAVLAGQAADYALAIGAGLLIIDTLGQWSGTSGDAENSAGEAQRAMAPLQVAAARGLAVLIARHERKAGGEVGESGRGSSAYSGCVDTVVTIRRPQADAHGGANVRVLQSLSRYDEVPETLVIELTPDGYQTLGDAAAYARGQARARLLAELPRDEATALDADALLEKAKITRSLGHDVLKALVAEGLAERFGRGKKGDPFRYRYGAAIHSSTIESDIVDESETATGPPDEETDSSTTRGIVDESGARGRFDSSTTPISIVDESICEVCQEPLGGDEVRWCGECHRLTGGAA